MTWQKVGEVPPPVGRPVLVRTAEGGDAIVAFLGPDGVWYEGGALVQTSSTILGGAPVQWCEPKGEESL